MSLKWEKLMLAGLKRTPCILDQHFLQPQTYTVTTYKIGIRVKGVPNLVMPRAYFEFSFSRHSNRWGEPWDRRQFPEWSLKSLSSRQVTRFVPQQIIPETPRTWFTLFVQALRDTERVVHLQVRHNKQL